MNSAERQRVWSERISDHQETCGVCLRDEDTCDKWLDLIASYNEARELESEQEQPTRTWECGNCGETVERWRGQGDVECECGAQYNSFGQRLRDDWRGNSAWYDDDVDDMEGFERQQLSYESYDY